MELSLWALRTPENTIPLSTFSALGLSAEVLKSLAELGFETPSDIQERAIPHLMGDSADLIGLAQTGTGKTAAFGLPLLEQIDPADESIQALVLSPTRELCRQIAGELAKFSKYQQRLNVLAVYGGAPIVGQIKALRRPQQILIATPGRLIDLLDRKAVKLDQLRYLVLDEADEMLNMGFKDELDNILSHTPAEKKTWLFSATMPTEIRRIVKTYMTDPVEVKIDSKNLVNVNIAHQYVVVHPADKVEALMRFVDVDPEMRAIVFCRTRHETNNLADILMSRSYRSDALHGDMSQAQRDQVMHRFKSGGLQILVATDVAARGIDVNDLTHVFHYSLPDDNAYYTHRSGRTARAGKDGLSIAFISKNEGYKINRLGRNLGIDFERIYIPNMEQIAEQMVTNWCNHVLSQTEGPEPSGDLITTAFKMFSDLSKEDLIKLLLQQRLRGLNLNDARDLNKFSAIKMDGGGGGNKRSGGGKPYKGKKSGGGNKHFRKNGAPAAKRPRTKKNRY